MSFCLVEGGGRRWGAKSRITAVIMYFTAAALKPPAGLNQIPSFLTPLVVSKTELPKSGTQTQHARNAPAISGCMEVWGARTGGDVTSHGNASQKELSSKPHWCRTTILWTTWSWWLVLAIIIASSNQAAFPSRVDHVSVCGDVSLVSNIVGMGKYKLHFNKIYGCFESVWHDQEIGGVCMYHNPK